MKKIIQKLSFGLLLAMGVTTSAFAQWQNVGSAGFSAGGVLSTSLAFNPSGEPYVAYSDASIFNKATVMKFNGTTWENVGSAGFSAGNASNTSLAFSPSGEPYVAYRDGAHASKACLMKFDGTNWVGIGMAFSFGIADFTSLAFSPSGDPYVAYRDASAFGNLKATVMKFNGGMWENVGATGFSAGQADNTSIAFSPSGEPYVAYKDGANSNKATVMKFDGTNWVNVGTAGFSAGAVDNTPLAFSPSGEPYVAYYDGANSGKATVMKFDGTDWVNVGSAGFSAGAAGITSLAFNSIGEPYVAYTDGANSNKATVMKFDGSNWINIGTLGFSAGVSSYTSLALNPNGEAYVAYRDAGNSNKATVMKFVDAVVPTAPDAPTVLTATGSLNPVKVALNWADNATNEDGYKVERGTDGVNFTEIADLAVNSTSYDDLAVSEATTYHYRVYAYNTDGDSDFSNIAQVTTGSAVGIDEINNTITAVYPNPVNTVLNISVKENTNITIVNLLGATVAMQELNTGNNTVDVSGLVKGVYFIHNAKGGAVKFIKE